MDTIIVTAIVSTAAVFIAIFMRAPASKPDSDATERALAELQLQRDELSKLRFDTTRDRDELRDAVGKHEKAILRMGEDVRAAIVEMKGEATKLSMLHSQPRRL